MAAEAKIWEDFLVPHSRSLKDSDWRMDTALAVMQSWHQSESWGAPLKGLFLASHLGILSEDLEEGLVQKDNWVFLFRLLFCAT